MWHGSAEHLGNPISCRRGFRPRGDIAAGQKLAAVGSRSETAPTFGGTTAATGLLRTIVLRRPVPPNYVFLCPPFPSRTLHAGTGDFSLASVWPAFYDHGATVFPGSISTSALERK